VIQRYIDPPTFKSGVCAGDDEGSVEVVVEKANSEHVISVNLLISGMSIFSSVVILLSHCPDTSEYPKSHSLFCYTPDGDVSARIQKTIEDISDEPAKPLGFTVRNFVQSIAHGLSARAFKVKVSPRDEATDEEEAASDGVDDFDAFDFDDDIAITSESELVMAKIQECVHFSSIHFI
jgi:ubiquitin-conjugating enzyme E2 Q